MVGQAAVGEIRERVADGRKLPVEHGGDAGLMPRIEHVMGAIVTVHHRGFVSRRQVRLEPGDQPIHIGVFLDARADILLGPARQLPCDIALRAAEFPKPDGSVINPMQPREHRDELQAQRATLFARRIEQPCIGHDSALDVLHDVERLSEDALILAEQIHFRHGNAALPGPA